MIINATNTKYKKLKIYVIFRRINFSMHKCLKDRPPGDGGMIPFSGFALPTFLPWLCLLLIFFNDLL